MKSCSYILFFLIIFCNNAVSSEIDTIWYNSDWKITSKENAEYFRIASFDLPNGYFTGEVRDYYMNGNLEMTGHYKNGFKDGLFNFYYSDGSIRLNAQYKENKRTGTWIYTSENGTETKNITYSDGTEKLVTFLNAKGEVLVKDGNGQFYEERNDGFSTFIIKGKVKNGYKDKVWKQYRDRRLIYDEQYRNSKFIKGYSYIYSTENRTFPILEFDEAIPELFEKEDIQFERGVKIKMNDIAKYFSRKILQSRGLEEKTRIINSRSELLDLFTSNIIYNQNEIETNYSEIITITFELNAENEIIDYSFSDIESDGLKQEMIRIIKSIKQLNVPAENNKIIFNYHF